MTTRDAGLVALGFLGGMIVSALALGTAMAEVERGRSIDAWLRTLSARSWKVERP